METKKQTKINKKPRGNKSIKDLPTYKGRTPSTNGKYTPTLKEKRFAQVYVEKKSATKALLDAYDIKTKNRNSVHQMATQTLRKPQVQSEIERIYAREGLDDSNVARVHARNLEQDKNLAVSQQAVRDYHTIVKGRTGDKAGASQVNVGLIIER